MRPGCTGFVLLRDIRTGEINDGNERELNEDLFGTDVKGRSTTWYIVWMPIYLATLTTAFFIGWAAYAVRSFPDTFRGWCDAALGYIQANVTGTTGGGADIAATFFSALPGWLTALVDAGRANTIPLLAVLAALWYVFLLARRAFAGVPLLPWLFARRPVAYRACHHARRRLGAVVRLDELGLHLLAEQRAGGDGVFPAQFRQCVTRAACRVVVQLALRASSSTRRRATRR